MGLSHRMSRTWPFVTFIYSRNESKQRGYFGTNKNRNTEGAERHAEKWIAEVAQNWKKRGHKCVLSVWSNLVCTIKENNQITKMFYTYYSTSNLFLFITTA